ITNIPLRGLRAGATTTLTIEGNQLLPTPRILLPGIQTQTLKPGANPQRIQLDVQLAKDIAPGMYALRLANELGISNSVVVDIDGLNHLPFSANIAELPVALHGNLSGSATLVTSFAGKKGQRVVVDIEARRLGAAIEPVLELLDSHRVQIAGSFGQ